jgi:hypothetical protein
MAKPTEKLPIRLDLTEVTKSLCDKTGRLAAIEVRTTGNADHMLLMPFKVASKLFWALCNAGLTATTAKEQAGTTSERAELTDYPVKPSSAAAALAEDGMVDLVLRFGELQLSARLDASDARSLASQLQQASVDQPSTLQ